MKRLVTSNFELESVSIIKILTKYCLYIHKGLYEEKF